LFIDAGWLGSVTTPSSAAAVGVAVVVTDL
jgi:hypothetical protein